MKVTEKQMKRLRTELLHEKKELEDKLAQTDHFGLNHAMRDTLDELSLYDNHPADIGTELFERGKDIALNENAEHHLEEVNAALARMDEGTYGVCVACAKDIPYARLEAVPTAAYCIEHAPDPHVSEDRPVEEDILRPGFGRTSFDEIGGDTEWNEFDGEDAWQAVNRYGTSNSPALAEDPEAFHYDNLYIESDENVGYVEPIESFLATDIYGQQVMVVRNNEYQLYIDHGEGDASLLYENKREERYDR